VLRWYSRLIDALAQLQMLRSQMYSQAEGGGTRLHRVSVWPV
jgi:hypothetical protein